MQVSMSSSVGCDSQQMDYTVLQREKKAYFLVHTFRCSVNGTNRKRLQTKRRKPNFRGASRRSACARCCAFGRMHRGFYSLATSASVHRMTQTNTVTVTCWDLQLRADGFGQRQRNHGVDGHVADSVETARSLLLAQRYRLQRYCSRAFGFMVKTRCADCLSACCFRF